MPHNLRPRHTDPISHCPISRQNMYWLNGEHYDVTVLAKTLHTMGKAIDPIHQTPLRQKELDAIDKHLRQIGSTIPSLKNLRNRVQALNTSDTSLDDDIVAAETQCNECMDTLYNIFDQQTRIGTFVPDDIYTIYQTMPLLTDHLYRMARRNLVYTTDLIDIYLHKLRGPPNRPTIDFSEYLLKTCLRMLSSCQEALKNPSHVRQMFPSRRVSTLRSAPPLEGADRASS